MKTKLTRLLGALALLALSTISSQLSTASAQGTAFTYQGRLNSSGAVANGSYDLQFTLFATNVTGAPIAGPVTNTAVGVTNGLFTTLVAFGPGIFTGGSNWLQIAVSTNAANVYSTLAPRQQLTPVPYAITAENVSGMVAAASISGTIPLAQLPSALVTNNESGVSLNGSFTGNGANVTNVNAAALNGLNATNFWQLGGNNIAAGQFLGSTNNQPVELWVNGTRALRLEPAPNDSSHSNIVNVVGGSSANFVQPGISGAVIGGGGALSYYGSAATNSVAADMAVVGGGWNNSIQTLAGFSFLGGGYQNVIQYGSGESVLVGGMDNIIGTNDSNVFLGGGYENNIQADAYGAFLGAGQYNSILTNADNASLGGGQYNVVSGALGTVPGGDSNVAGTNSFAAGHRAKALLQGDFVWADSQAADFSATTNNQFLIRAVGGVGIGTTSTTINGLAVAGQVAAAGFTGNGANVTNVNAAALNGLNATNFWQLAGNNVAAGQFLGSLNNQPVEIWANGTRALRLEPNATAPNVIGGSVANSDSATPGVVGSTIGGGIYNTNASSYAFIGGGFQNLIQTNAYNSVIGGGGQNLIQTNSSYAVIAGGYKNTLQTNAYNSVIGGGAQNTIQSFGEYCMIGGGVQNTIYRSCDYAVIVGGTENMIQSCVGSTIGGGYWNTMAGYYSMIGGGYLNTIQSSAAYSMIGGGYNNYVSGSGGFIGGGGSDGVSNPGNSNAGNAASIVGGLDNAIQSGANYSFIGGGTNNAIQSGANYSAIGGGINNAVSGTGGFIGGGGSDGVNNPGNTNAGNAAAIVGGLENLIASGGNYSAIGGGYFNTIQTNAYYSVIAGGTGNTIQTNAGYSMIGGGDNNTIQEIAEWSTIGGGDNNTIEALAEWSTIAGGSWNWIQVNAEYSVISGGDNNVVSGVGGFVGGGGYDGTLTIGNNNAGNAAVIVGGMANAIASGGNYSVIPGGYGNSIGASAQCAFAAGNSAQANHSGAFVWSDNSGAGGNFCSTGPNQFLIRAQGGVGIGATNLAVGGALTIRSPNAAPPIAMNAADNALVLGSAGVSSYKWLQSYGGSLTLNPLGNNVGVNTSNPTHPFQVVNAYCDGSSWVNVSDRNLKQDFAPVDARAMLTKVAALPVQSWVYKAQPAQKHVGPVAQDFRAAFGLGQDDTSIATVDEGGVALAAIQGLNEKLEAEAKAKDARISELENRLNQLEQTLQSLTNKK